MKALKDFQGGAQCHTNAVQERRLREAQALKVEAQGCIDKRKFLLVESVQRHQMLDLDIVSDLFASMLPCTCHWLKIHSAGHHGLVLLCTYFSLISGFLKKSFLGHPGLDRDS